MIHSISERYYRPTRIFVTGIGAAMILPWVVLFSRRNLLSNPVLPANSGDVGRLEAIISAPWLVQFLAVWLFLLFLRYLFDFASDWLNDDNEDQFIWRTVMLALFVLLLPIFNRILLYPYLTAPLFDPARGILNALFNFTQGWRPENVVLFFYIASWAFAIWVSSNVMGAFEVGRLFAVALLSTALSVGWLEGLGEPAFLGIFLPFILCGLGALTLSLVDSKVSRGYHSPGGQFSLGTSIQLGGITLIFALIAAWLGTVVSPSSLRAVLSIFRPVWRLIGIVAGWIWLVVEPILEYLFNALATIIASLMSRIDLSSSFEGDAGPAEETTVPDVQEVFANSAELRFLVIGLFVLLGLFIMWVAFNRTVLKRYRNEAQQEIEETQTSDSNILSSAFSQLRSWFDTLRGLAPKSLLEPITVENIYANVSRLASRQGYERAVSQTPDQYLPDLIQAFPDHAEPLTALTLSYMEVYYGNAAVSDQQLETLKGYYARISDSVSPNKPENSDE